MIAKYTKTLSLIALVTIQLMQMACERGAVNSLTQQEDQANLEKMRSEILKLAQSKTCNNAGEWEYIALGQKACGGPVEYIAYSTKIDTASFKQKVQTYTAEMKKFNVTWNIASDCMMILPPGGITCENGKPVFLPYNDPTLIVGTWKLTASYADPGDGSGKYKPVTGPDQFITFDVRGKVSGNSQLASYKILDVSRIEFTTSSNEKLIFWFKIRGNELELNPPCIEGCGNKYIRM